MERYFSAIEKVKESKDAWAYNALKSSSPDEQVAQLRRYAEDFIEVHDDDAAVRAIGWLLHAISDTFLIPHLKTEVGVQCLPWDSEGPIWEAKGNARAKRAETACALYSFLPPRHEKTAKEWQDGKYKSVTHRSPTLPKTRGLLLGEIAGWWRDMPANDDRFTTTYFFDYLTGVRFEFSDEWNILFGVIRNATDKSFSVPRITDCITQFLKADHPKQEEIAGIMMVCRARNIDPGHAKLEFSLLQRMMNTGPEAFDYLCRKADGIVKTSREIRLLLNALQPRTSYGGIDHSKPAVLGEIQVEYVDESFVILTIKAKVSRGVHNRFCDDAALHAEFEEARRILLPWKSVAPRCAIKLNFYVEDTRQKKEPFVRSQTFES